MAETTVTIKAKNKTKKAFNSVNGSLKRMSGLLFNAKTAVAGLVGVGGFGALIVSASKSADSLAKTSDKLGITTEALSGLRHAAELTGVSSETMDMALQRMVRRLSEAANGTGEAVNALKELGLSAQELSAMAPDEAFQRLSAAMAETSTQGDKVRLAMKLFDTEGVALVNTMALGEQGLKDATEAAEAYGVALSRADAAKIERANDAMLRVQTVIKGIGTTISVHLAPFIEVIANKLAKASKESNGFSASIMSGMETAVRSVAFLGDVIQGLEVTIKIIEVAFAGFGEAIINTIFTIADGWRKLANLIPGLDIGPMEKFEAITKAAGERTSRLISELDALVTKPMPSEAIETFFNSVTEAATAASIKVAEAKAKISGDDTEARLDAEFELLSADTDRHLRLIEMETLAKKKQLQIEKSLSKDRFEVAKGITGNMATLMASSSKREFEIGKKFAIANALIKGYEAVTSSYAAGAKIGGPVLGGAYAVAAGYATKIQIDNIKKQTFGGGGSLSVSGGAGGGIATGATFNGGAPTGITGQAENLTGGITTINLVGKDRTFSTDEVSDMFGKFKEAIDRGDKVLFNSDSRQALELSA